MSSANHSWTATLDAHTPTVFVGPRTESKSGTTGVFTLLVMLLAAGHIAAGSLIDARSAFGYAWFAASAAVALWIALFRPLAESAAAMGYTAGAEVIWRALKLGLPWETSKYLMCALCVIVLARSGRKLRLPIAPMLYFVLLLPGCLALFADPRWGFTDTRKLIAAGLAAPLSLLLCALALAQLRFSPSLLKRALIGYILPMLAMAAYTAVATYTDPDIVFTGESNSATSGGFGPNQVSTVLGLASLLAIVIAVWVETRFLGRVIAAVLALFLAAQSAMTFSRGGLYGAGGALAIGLVMSVRSREAWSRLLLIGLVTSAAALLIVPRLDAFTGGKLLARFTDTNPTNRDVLVVKDLDLFRENPVFGVGPAGSARAQGRFMASASHTEFTRVLAEHGFLGGLGMLVLIVGGLVQTLRVRHPQAQSLTALMFMWAALTMMHAAMRTVSPAFMIGLAWSNLGFAFSDRFSLSD